MALFGRKKTGGVDQQAKEAYFTASQGQLIWARFKSQRSAMIALWALVVMILMGFFAPFLSPYNPTIAGRDTEYENGAPQIPKFWDENGFSARPFIYATERERSIKTNFRWVVKENRDKRLYLQFFVKDWQYSFIELDWDMIGLDLRLLTSDRHLFGVEGGKVHLFGTDASGKDIFSRTLREHNRWVNRYQRKATSKRRTAP